MAKGFAIHNAPTDHGGFVPATQMRSSQMGNLFICAGDGHFCPKCKTWSTVVKSHDHVIFDGKSVAYAGDRLTCGAKLLAQQSHVVGDSGNSSTGLSLLNTLKPTSNESFLPSTKFQIELTDILAKPFVPLGLSSFEGNPISSELTIFGKVKTGLFEAISLEVENEGGFIEVKRINKQFSTGSEIKITWDGFINGIYNSKYITKSTGLKFRIKGFNGGHAICLDEKKFNFKYFNKDWIDIVISKKTKTIRINLRVNFIAGKAIGLHDWSMVPKTAIKKYGVQAYSSQTRPFNQLLALAIEGINYYWSRNSTHPEGKNITINGTKYQVYVTAVASQERAMPEMKLTYITNKKPDNPTIRSSNWALSRKTAYTTGYLQFDDTWYFYKHDFSDKEFKLTVAHEVGHAIVESYSNLNNSATHHGSSTYTQVPLPGTRYPRTGEINLMKYANEELYRVSGWNTRSIVSQQDVFGLLILSGLSVK